MKTWTYSEPSKQTFWLRDFLPGDIPNARIWTYGYDANIVGSRSIAGIRDIATNLLSSLKYRLSPTGETGPMQYRRPVIFICHSLGGLVVKKAILVAKNEMEKVSQTKEVYSSIYGIVFLGTPHQGSSAANLASYAASVLKHTYLARSVNDRFLKALNEESEELLDLIDQFRNSNHLVVISVYELEVTGPVKAHVVKATSAKLGWSADMETSFGSQCDHRQLARFRDRDSRYQDLLGPLGSMVEDASKGCMIHKEERSEILKCAHIVDYERRMLELCEVRCDDTCTWIWEEANLKSWQENPESCNLWLSADVGSGKSVILAHVLEQKKAALGSDLVLYYFFSPNVKFQDPLNALASILHQILLFEKRICSVIQNQAPHNKHFCDNRKNLEKALQECLRILKRRQVLLFVDGVDECDPRSFQQFLTAVFGLKVYTPCIKTFITSRPHILSQLAQQWPQLRGCIDYHLVPLTRHLSADISKYLELKTKELIEHSRFRGPKFREVRVALEHLPGIIQERAGCTFLIASLSMEMFTTWAGTRSLKDVEDRIKRLKCIASSGTDLHNLYSGIMESLPEEELPKALKLFKWLAVSDSDADLSLNEARIILALEPDHESNKDLKSALDPGDDIADVLRQICGPLIKVVNATQTVQWFHASAREFTLNEVPCDSKLSKWLFNEDQAELEISVLCLKYLSFSDFLNPGSPDTARTPQEHQSPQQSSLEQLQDESDRRLLQSYPLLRYTSHFWAHHVQRSQESLCKPENWGYIREWAKRAESLKLTFRLYWYYKGIREFKEYPCKPSWLHLFSYFGLHGLIKKMLEEEAYDPNEFDLDDGLTPVHLAAINGHTDVARLLTEWQIGVTGDAGVTPTNLAIEYGHIDTVNALLESGCKLGSLDMALEYTALGGHLDLIRLLFKHSADVNCKLPKHGSALEAAALKGHKEVVLLLLELGANVNGRYGGPHGHPLHAAAFSCFIEIVTILLERGADINAVGGMHHTALQSAAFRGNEELVKYLLDRRADVNITGGDYGSALGAAEVLRHSNVATLLRGHGAKEDPLAKVTRRLSTFDQGTRQQADMAVKAFSAGDLSYYYKWYPRFQGDLNRAIATRNYKSLEYLLLVCIYIFGAAVKVGKSQPLDLMAKVGMTVLQFAVSNEKDGIAVGKISKAWTKALLIPIRSQKPVLVRRILNLCLTGFKKLVDEQNFNGALDLVGAGIEIFLAISESENSALMDIMADLWSETLEGVLAYPSFRGQVLTEINHYAKRFPEAVGGADFRKARIIARAGITALDFALIHSRVKAIDSLVSIYWPLLQQVLDPGDGASILSWVARQGTETLAERFFRKESSLDMIDRLLRIGWKLARAGKYVAVEELGIRHDMFCQIIAKALVTSLEIAQKAGALSPLEGAIMKVVRKEIEEACDRVTDGEEIQRQRREVNDCYLIVFHVGRRELERRKVISHEELNALERILRELEALS